MENQIRPQEARVERTKIGLHNVSAMMQNMGGRCDAEEKENRFRVTLRFPCLPPEAACRACSPGFDGEIKLVTVREEKI